MKMEGFTHEALEKDIAELIDVTKEKTGGTVTKEALKETLSERVYGPDPRITPGPAEAEQLNAKPNMGKPSPLPQYAVGIPPEAKLEAEELLDLAWHKGLSVAIKKVKMTSPLIMDLFHDAITERLYDEFKKRGILK